MDCQQNVSHVFESGKQKLSRKLEESIDEGIKMNIIFENFQWSSCHNLKRGGIEIWVKFSNIYEKDSSSKDIPLQRNFLQGVFANAWESMHKEEKGIDNLKTELIAKEAKGKADL
ncbi:hypothetical protein WN48_07844 [Eufriesea mexicana]|nr:hypothetical protein WN48_07844 [Eufriesea mexicana]